MAAGDFLKNIRKHKAICTDYIFVHASSFVEKRTATVQHICLHTSIQFCNTAIHIYIYIHNFMYIYICLYMCVCACMYIYIYIYIYICIYINVYIYIYIYIYIIVSMVQLVNN